MGRFLSAIGFGLVLGAGGSAAAQQAGAVQLPSFSTFGVNTSVSVPDRGSISLGGGGGSSLGSTAYGPGLPGNRSFGRSLTSSNTTLHATIHDMNALDRATLQRAQRNRSKLRGAGVPHAPEDAGETPTPQGHGARRLAAARQSTAGRVPPGSVAEARLHHATEREREEVEARFNLKRARDAQATGKASVAALFYKLAAKQATGELKQQIDEEADSLASSVKAPRLAHSARRRVSLPQAAARD